MPAKAASSWIPAPFTRIWIGASSASLSRTARAASASVTSNARARACPPASMISRATACASSSLRFECTCTKCPAAPSRRQIAAPRVPLPPVTKAHLGSPLMVLGRGEGHGHVEDDGCPSADQPRCRGSKLEFIQSRTLVAHDAHRLAKQIRFHIIETQSPHAYPANAGEKPGARPVCGAVLAAPPRLGQDRAVHGHRLRRQFYTAGDSEPAVRAQRVIGGAVTAARA